MLRDIQEEMPCPVTPPVNSRKKRVAEVADKQRILFMSRDSLGGLVEYVEVDKHAAAVVFRGGIGG